MPLGPGGIDTDIKTGRPIKKRQPQGKSSQALQRMRQATIAGYEISRDIHLNNQVLRVWLEQYQSRLVELAKNDPVLQALEGPIRAIRAKLEVAPILAKRHAFRVLGPNLSMIAEEGTDAAP